jgi:hypothetical protein
VASGRGINASHLPPLGEVSKRISSASTSSFNFAAASVPNPCCEGVQLDDTLLLIEPEVAGQYEASQRKPPEKSPEETGAAGGPETSTGTGTGAGVPDKTPGGAGGAQRPRSFHGTVEVAPATAKMRLVQIADEIVSVLGSDPNASVKVVVEISAEFPEGAKDTVKRAVSENARSLSLKSADWE